MTIEAKLIEGPKGYGLPEHFSLTGASRASEQGAVVMVRANKFFGFAEGEGGRVEQPYYDLAPIEIKQGQTETVEILFNDKNPKKRTVQSAVYEITGT
jgi:hypothetical protein